MNFFAFLANLLESFCIFPTDLDLGHSDDTLKYRENHAFA